MRFALLIGSLATEEVSSTSDIDIAIYIDPEIHERGDPTVAVKFGVLMEKTLKTSDVDVVVLNDATPTMKFSAIKTGIPLFIVDEGQYEDFFVRTLSEYYDNLSFLDSQYEDAKALLGGGHD